MTLTPSEQRAVEAAREWFDRDEDETPQDRAIIDAVFDSEKHRLVYARNLITGFACGHLSRSAEVAALREALRDARFYVENNCGLGESVEPLLSRIDTLLTTPAPQ